MMGRARTAALYATYLYVSIALCVKRSERTYQRMIVISQRCGFLRVMHGRRQSHAYSLFFEHSHAAEMHWRLLRRSPHLLHKEGRDDLLYCVPRQQRCVVCLRVQLRELVDQACYLRVAGVYPTGMRAVAVRSNRGWAAGCWEWLDAEVEELHSP